MPRAHVVIALVVSIAAMLTLSLPAHAEDAPRLEIRYSDLENEGAVGKVSPAPRRECTPRYMAGPATGIPLGLGTAGLGSALVFVASAPYTDTSLPDSRASGIAGAVMIPVGVAAFIYSSVKLAKNRQTRLRVCGKRRRSAWQLSAVDLRF
jgi:hypothetical protein